MLKRFRNIAAVSALTISASSPVIAGTHIDTVVITGTVVAVATVVITPANNSFNITPGTAITNQDIGSIEINSNDPTGYKVTMEGAGAASNLLNGANTVAYQANYNSTGLIGLTTTAATVESVAAPTAGAITRTFTVDIAAGAATGKPAGAYTDTVTVTIIPF